MQIDPDKVRRARQSKAMAQVDLADAAGIRQATVSGIENGSPARMSTVRKLAEALGMEPVELMSPVNKDSDQDES